MRVSAEAKSLFSALVILTSNLSKFAQEKLGQGQSMLFSPARLYGVLIIGSFKLEKTFKLIKSNS